MVIDAKYKLLCANYVKRTKIFFIEYCNIFLKVKIVCHFFFIIKVFSVHGPTLEHDESKVTKSYNFENALYIWLFFLFYKEKDTRYALEIKIKFYTNTFYINNHKNLTRKL